MAVKYFIRYFDLIGIEHKLDIYDDSYEDEPIQIDGKIRLTYSETDASLESIRGQGLSVELEADENLTFGDLWTEDEKTLKVIYTRESLVLFQGWLNPEGFFEDYVNTNWMVSFDCVDGLGYLKDLSFVDNDGFVITGRRTYLEILSLALRRTGLELNINTDIQIRYTGLDDTLDILDNTYANTERYVKDDGETIMDCEEVLRDILEPFGAVLTSFNGEWYIYKPNQLYINTEANFYSYTYLGVINPVTPSKTLDFYLNIGSEINSFLIHHCNANQSIRNTASIGAYRINYKYGLANDLIPNRFLISLNGSTIDDWTIISNNFLTIPQDGNGGIEIDFVNDLLVENVINSTAVDVLSNIDLELRIAYNILSNNSTGSIYFRYEIRLDDNDSNDFYYLTNLNIWLLNSEEVLLKNINEDTNEINLTLPTTPVEGKITILVWTPGTIKPSVIADGSLEITEISLVNTSDSPKSVKGEFHTFQRTTKPSAKVKEITKVATGDNPSDFYEGTIYKNDKNTPTSTWERKTFTEEKPLLRIMGEETMRMNQLPSRVFTGDIYGFFNYLSVIVIDGLDGLFMPIKYSYDTKNNIISSEFRQIYADELEDIDYDFQLDYGNTVKPTIV